MSKERIWHLFARKLTGEASVEELQELEQALQEDSSLYYELLLLQEVWELNPTMDSDYLEATYLLHHQKMQKLGIEPGNPAAEIGNEEIRFIPVASLRKKLTIATLLLGVFLFAAFFYITRTKNEKLPLAEKVNVRETEKVVSTKKASKTQLVLPDGTKVWLNADSKLNYERIGNKGNREVFLTGEAYFDVVKNKQRPFIIHTASIDVKVLGTEFNVKAYPNDATVETSLIHGSVQVVLKNDPGKTYFLKPNQKLVLYKEAYLLNTVNKIKDAPLPVPKVMVAQLNQVKGTAKIVETAWLRNELHFNDELFKEVALKMERWYDVTIEFENEKLKQERLNGPLPSESLMKALEAWKFTTPSLNYRIEENKVIIY